MADSRRFIQLSHPGSEATLDCGEAWHSIADGHQRKFMQLDGRWIAENGDEHGDELWAWGEWEAQSELLRDLEGSGDRGLPLHLRAPFYAVMDDCRELHNTDPFIFGERLPLLKLPTVGPSAQWPEMSRPRFGHRIWQQGQPRMGARHRARGGGLHRL